MAGMEIYSTSFAGTGYRVTVWALVFRTDAAKAGFTIMLSVTQVLLASSFTIYNVVVAGATLIVCVVAVVLHI